MEPRRCSRGDRSQYQVLFCGHSKLQWSRDVAVAVTPPIAPAVKAGFWLQWSRDVAVAVTR